MDAYTLKARNLEALASLRTPPLNPDHDEADEEEGDE
jgi:hypothetical protein